MGKLSIVIPSRDERFLIPTIDDIFRNARGEVEVVAVIDSDKWPDNWKAVTDRHPNLHTIHHGQPKGMRAAINSGVGSAISRGAKFIAKFDGHCSFSEGFDEVLKAECEPNWIVVPRRGRLDPENWVETELNKPPIDYHYLSFPDDPNDFGGPGLNGKVWAERAVERKDILLDEEMSSQGSGWFMHAAYFSELELMDEANYGPFWNEFQELGLKCWLSGGKVMVNKKCKYLHLHKGRTYGRGYHLPESWLKQGRNHVMLWPWNEAWPKQTLPFKWLIERFHPVPSWPENWEEVLYTERKPRGIIAPFRKLEDSDMVKVMPDSGGMEAHIHPGKLKIHFAAYGIGGHPTNDIDVTDRVTELAKNGTLDVIVNNSTLTPGQNPFRGKKKRLLMRYSFDGGEGITIEHEEKDWLIIGPAISATGQSGDFRECVSGFQPPIVDDDDPRLKTADFLVRTDGEKVEIVPNTEKPIPNLWPKSIAHPPLTAPALNDYLVRKFSISPQRLRGPMPIELRDFHRNDLAQLFAELGFKRGAEIGVAEGKYSEILMKANPDCELLLVDPWHAYSDNPQNKSKEKNEFAFNETKRRIEALGGSVGQMIMKLSMDAVREVEENSLDFVYIDGHHAYPYVMCDIIEWAKRVRSGGVVALDDIYQLNEKWGAGPMEAIYDYTRAMRINPWWLIAAHKSVDAFFVKP